jgi:hypothetical protein
VLSGGSLVAEEEAVRTTAARMHVHLRERSLNVMRGVHPTKILLGFGASPTHLHSPRSSSFLILSLLGRELNTIILSLGKVESLHALVASVRPSVRTVRLSFLFFSHKN